MDKPDAEQLLRRIQEKDEAALEALIQLYHKKIFSLAYRMLGDTAHAEDAVVQVWYKIWTKAYQWREDANANTWIYQIAVRTIIDQQRKQQRWWNKVWFWLSPAIEDTNQRPDELVAKEEDQAKREQRFREVLKQLSEQDRALVHLYYYENHSLAEIAEMLGESRNVLKTRLSRVRQKLRGMLSGEEL